MPVHSFYRLIRFSPLVGFSINKFQPTLTMVKYLPAWHLVGDSQSLGMLQTGPLQAKSLLRGRKEMQAWGTPFPWVSSFLLVHWNVQQMKTPIMGASVSGAQMDTNTE